MLKQDRGDDALRGKQVPSTPAAQAELLVKKTGAGPMGVPAVQGAPDPRKAALAAKMAAKTIGQTAPAEQKVALAAKLAAKATDPTAPSEQKAALSEKLAAAVKAAPDSKKAELVKKVSVATAAKEAPAANKVAHFAASLTGGGSTACPSAPAAGGRS